MDTLNGDTLPVYTALVHEVPTHTSNDGTAFQDVFLTSQHLILSLDPNLSRTDYPCIGRNQSLKGTLTLKNYGTTCTTARIRVILQ